jgi:hypothetical protein
MRSATVHIGTSIRTAKNAMVSAKTQRIQLFFGDEVHEVASDQRALHRGDEQRQRDRQVRR